MPDELFFSGLAVLILTMALLMLVGARRSKLPCTMFWGEEHNFVKTDLHTAVCTGCGMKLKRSDQWVRDFSR